MQSTAVVGHNRFLLFVGGTFLTQAIVLCVAWIVKANYNPPSAPAIDFDQTESAAVAALPELNEAEQAPAVAAPHVVQKQVRKGDTLTKIWTDNGGTYAGGLSAAKAFKDAGVPMSALRLG